ncbi:hypothetical protein D5085_02400 [Ectothiorhodospiraceae bacterium BW-2]|nr:hypothetical protein D5085_02400 [Ectothiorhodospiraceae bacterium BW-2]
MRMILLLILLNIHGVALSTTVLPAGLQKLYDHATYIAHVRVLQHKNEKDNNGIYVTRTQFDVIYNIKGNLGREYQLTQFGINGIDDNGIHRDDQIVSFEEGKRYVIFLPEPSELGFSSPLALTQGRFNVIENGTTETVANGREISELIMDVPTSLTAEIDFSTTPPEGSQIQPGEEGQTQPEETETQTQTPPEGSQMPLGKFISLLIRMERSSDQ